MFLCSSELFVLWNFQVQSNRSPFFSIKKGKKQSGSIYFVICVSWHFQDHKISVKKMCMLTARHLKFNSFYLYKNSVCGDYYISFWQKEKSNIYIGFWICIDKSIFGQCNNGVHSWWYVSTHTFWFGCKFGFGHSSGPFI